MVADIYRRSRSLLDATHRIVGSSDARRWCPLTPTDRQRAFLARTEMEVLFGGAAGPGKSTALLMAALEHVDVPGYAALILRRTYPDLAQPGGLMDVAHQWLADTAAEWSGVDKRWRFPSGATLSFGYIDTDRDRYRYQGGEYHTICYDELTQLREHWYTYLLSRLRRPKSCPVSDVPLRARSATNPGGVGQAWVAERWGIREDGTQDETAATDPESGELRVFVPALLADNPHLDVAEYRRALSRLDATTRAQLERGQWVSDSTGLVLPLRRSSMVERGGLDPSTGRVARDLHRVIGVDLGASEVEETIGISIIGWSPTTPQLVWVEHAEKHRGMMLSELARILRELEDRFSADAIVGDEGALGAQMGRELRRRYGIPIRAAKKSGRLGWMRLLRDAARSGDLLVVQDECAALVEDAAALLWHEDGRRVVGPSHVYDATLYAWRHARAWASEEPEDVPPPGSREAMERWEREQREREVREIRDQQRSWWRR